MWPQTARRLIHYRPKIYNLLHWNCNKTCKLGKKIKFSFWLRPFANPSPPCLPSIYVFCSELIGTQNANFRIRKQNWQCSPIRWALILWHLIMSAFLHILVNVSDADSVLFLKTITSSETVWPRSPKVVLHSTSIYSSFEHEQMK